MLQKLQTCIRESLLLSPSGSAQLALHPLSNSLRLRVTRVDVDLTRRAPPSASMVAAIQFSQRTECTQRLVRHLRTTVPGEPDGVRGPSPCTSPESVNVVRRSGEDKLAQHSTHPACSCSEEPRSKQCMTERGATGSRTRNLRHRGLCWHHDDAPDEHRAG